MNPQEEKFEAARAEIRQMYRAFLEDGGKLPEGFSCPYNLGAGIRRILRGTPFDAFLKRIDERVDFLRNRSGVSDWLYLEGTADLPAAIVQITGWATRHREMDRLIRQKCHVGNTYIMPPVSVYCREKVMVVTGAGSLPDSVPEEAVQGCRDAGVSFCRVLGEDRLYDLIERREMRVAWVEYPNYHDETYADWYFV